MAVSARLIRRRIKSVGNTKKITKIRKIKLTRRATFEEPKN